MILLNIKVLAKNDPPAFPELTLEQLQKGEIHGMIILEGGMQSGKTSVAFVVKNADGSYTFAELSAALFMAASAAVQGAQQRFGDPC